MTVDSKSNVVESNESNNTYTKQINVIAFPPTTPTLVNPSNGATGLSLVPTLQASTFSDPDSGDTHANSQWQVDNSSSFASPEWDSGQSYSAGIQVVVPAGKLSSSTTYYWRVRYKDNRGLWSNWSSSRYFTTAEPLPSKTINPNPADGATDQPATVTVSWSNGGGASSYNVYFGTDSTPDAGESKGNQTGLTYNPGTLQYNTTYYWRIDAKNTQGTTTGTVWRFTTGSAPVSKATNPVPANDAPDQPIPVTLSWSGPSNATGYDVYFGTDPKPDASEFMSTRSGRTYDPGVLAYGTTYYWRVDVKTAQGVTTGSIWRFTTEDLTEREILYVDASAPAGGDGSSWQTPFRYLQDALSRACLLTDPVEIRMAQGTYRPDQGAGIPRGGSPCRIRACRRHNHQGRFCRTHPSRALVARPQSVSHHPERRSQEQRRGSR